MNIGLLVTRFPPDVLGGAELQTKQLAAVLARRGHNVTVFTRRYHNRPYVEEQDGYVIRRRNELPIGAVRMLWDVVPALRQIARQRPKPEVLLCYQTFSSGFIGAIAQTILGIPAVVSIRGSKEYRLDESLSQRLLVPIIYKNVRRIIVQSQRICTDLHEQLQAGGEAELSEQLRRKLTVIPNGIERVTRPRSTGSKIVYVGRLIPEKGVADLLQAAKKLSGAEIVIVGDGPDRKRLETLAEGLPVTFVGQVPPSQVATFLHQARLLVLPSHIGDGLPNVILEAMASGVPAVATNTAGIPDLVHHDETGFLFAPGDIQQMTEYMRQILNDDALWQRLAQRSVEMVQKYSWDCIAPQIEQLLQQECLAG